MIHALVEMGMNEEDAGHSPTSGDSAVTLKEVIIDTMNPRTQAKRSSPILTFALLAFSIFLLLDVAQATFKKPPFNGSIFGKRGNGISDYDNGGRTLSSLCEVAVEACSVWFPQMEAKK